MFQNNTIKSIGDAVFQTLVVQDPQYWVIKNNFVNVNHPLYAVMFCNGFPGEFTYNYVHIVNSLNAAFSGPFVGSLDPSNNPSAYSVAELNGRPSFGSEVIDGGDPNPSYNDADATRNDAGAFGGSDPISNYFSFPVATDSIFFYPDADLDGYGDATNRIFANGQPLPPSYIFDGTDCNDADSLIHQPVFYFVDFDGDGWGIPMTHWRFVLLVLLRAMPIMVLIAMITIRILVR